MGQNHVSLLSRTLVQISFGFLSAAEQHDELKTLLCVSHRWSRWSAVSPHSLREVEVWCQSRCQWRVSHVTWLLVGCRSVHVNTHDLWLPLSVSAALTHHMSHDVRPPVDESHCLWSVSCLLAESHCWIFIRVYSNFSSFLSHNSNHLSVSKSMCQFNSLIMVIQFFII